MHNFKLQYYNVRVCAGYPRNSKTILEVKKQTALPKEHAHAPFLAQITVLVGNFGFQSMTEHYGWACTYVEK